MTPVASPSLFWRERGITSFCVSLVLNVSKKWQDRTTNGPTRTFPPLPSTPYKIGIAPPAGVREKTKK